MYGTNAFGVPILSIITLLPSFGALVLALCPAGAHRLIRGIAVVASGVDLLLAVWVTLAFDRGASGFQFIERQVWAKSLNLQYYLGLDGISVLLFLLASLLTFAVVLYSLGPVQSRVKEFFAAVLVLETGMLGTFAALDLSLFYVFFELTLIPTALLIGVWGYGPRKRYSAAKFFIYTLAGSLVMLAAIITVYALTFSSPSGPTLNYVDLLRLAPSWSSGFQIWMFWGFFFVFAIKTPIVPFHTWLPDAYVDAPVAGVVLLSGVLAKMGAYGFIRWLVPLSPDASRDLAFIPVVLSIIGVVYAAYLALVQTDLKRLIAYSSVAGMGFAVLGIFVFNTQGIQGAIIQMVSHGFLSSALFIGCGIIYERFHTLEIRRLGGLGTLMGVFAAVFVIASLGNLGLPGLSAFVAEVLVTIGVFQGTPWLAVPVYFYIILSAAYMLWAVMRVFYLGRPSVESRPTALSVYQEAVPLIGLTLLSLWLGVWATPFLDTTARSVAGLLSYLGVGGAGFQP